MWKWPQAAQRLWEFLKLPQHNGATKFKFKDWELTRELGVGRRCIQKALWWLQNVAMVINRYREYGHDAGRVIEIIINLAGPTPKAPPKTKSDRTKARPTPARPEQTPNIGTIPKATTEQFAAAARTARAAAEPPPMTAEEQAAALATLDAIRARAAAHRQAESDRRAQKSVKMTQDQLKAQLDIIKARLAGSSGADPGTPPAPSGP
jgi:hypothetical protein